MRSTIGLLTIVAVLLSGCMVTERTTRRGATDAGGSPVSSASGIVPLNTDPVLPSLTPGQKREQEKLLHRKLIGQMIEQGSFYAALAHCDAYDQQWGKDPNSQLLRADAQRMTGDIAAAQTGYNGLRDTALKAPALHGLSKIASQRGQWDQAAALLSEAIGLTPLNARLYSDQGLVFLLLDKPQAAFAALRKSEELEPGQGLAKANLALYAALYDDEALFRFLSEQLKWNTGQSEAVRMQALRIRTAHRNRQVPSPDIFSSR